MKCFLCKLFNEGRIEMYLYDIYGCSKFFKKFIRNFIFLNLLNKFYRSDICEILYMRIVLKCIFVFYFLLVFL